MFHTEMYAEQVYNSLALHRYHMHKEEVKRALLPILTDVYNIGYGIGVADEQNNLTRTDVSEPFEEEKYAVHAEVEVITHEEQSSCEQSSPDQPELSENTSSEN